MTLSFIQSAYIPYGMMKPLVKGSLVFLFVFNQELCIYKDRIPFSDLNLKALPIMLTDLLEVFTTSAH